MLRQRKEAGTLDQQTLDENAFDEIETAADPDSDTDTDHDAVRNADLKE